MTVHLIDIRALPCQSPGMARLARVVIPGIPHHVTQRGNGRGRTFFSDADYALYLKLVSESCRKAQVKCLAYVLMPNHVHLILVPKTEDGLRAALAPAHRAYAGILNLRRKKPGHFWQGRFGTVAMDEAHTIAALRYVLLNPVRARLVKKPEQWKWSSARAYLKKDKGARGDDFTDTLDMLEAVSDFAELLAPDDDVEAMAEALRRAESIGRPVGNESFMSKAERRTGRNLAPGKRGPKARRGKTSAGA